MNKEEFLIAVSNLGLNLTMQQQKDLETYQSFLEEYNKTTNLTTIVNEFEVYLKHFYDSLTIIKEIDLTKVDTLLDIGTGAGFPGMVLKICYPNLNVTLLDSNNKKLAFLDNLKNKLNLDVTLIHSRAEEFITDNREKFDVVVTRAVASLPILCELAIPYLKVNGYFIAMKSNALEEIAASTTILSKLDSKIININEFELPHEHSKRTLIKIEKFKPTNHKYPRQYNQIKKEVSNLLTK